ncbi:MAG: pentapeptide repeat-containing protein [Candidatus Cloacimonetes bacterium]|nr:pentapeptide repeat-containing protein [Candidatus Cloacimonadota bacterium]
MNMVDYLEDVNDQTIADLDGLCLTGRNFSHCRFESCDFSQLCFDGILDSCTFKDCNLSLTSFGDAMLQGVSFEGSKLVGVDFTRCNTLGLGLCFSGCLLRSCNFNFMDIQKTSFKECEIIETDFIGSNLAGSNFTGTSFSSVSFNNTNLSKAKFLGAQGYAINPLNNNIRNATFSLPEAISLLDCMGIKLV